MNKLLTNKFVGIFLSVALSFPMAFSAYADEPNPSLAGADACALDIALVLDESGSIGGNEDNVKNAAKAFVNTFLPATDTMIGVIRFDSSVTVAQGLTQNVTDLETAIDGLTAGGGTLWAPAINAGQAMLEGGDDRDDSAHRDLMVVFSDGEPSDIGAAETSADSAKTSTEPIRMLGVAIGAGANIDNFETITNGDGTSSISPPDAFSISTDIITSDFAQLEADLMALVNGLCAKTVKKDGNDKVINKNGAYVKNVVSSTADSGDNYAGGSMGGNGGNAGGVLNNGSENDANRNTTGAGGRGGNAGIGGTVITGNATSGAGATTFANDNLTEINRCACTGAAGGDVMVKNKNRVMTKNIVRSTADSGDNSAMGSVGGNGGAAGSVQNNGTDNDADGNTTGNGGSGGAAAGGELETSGVVSTGNATSFADVLNKLNRTVTRILR